MTLKLPADEAAASPLQRTVRLAEMYVHDVARTGPSLSVTVQQGHGASDPIELELEVATAT